MKSLWLPIAVMILIVSAPSATALAQGCCGAADAGAKSETPRDDDASTHGGTLTRKGAFVSETVIHSGRMRVYVFDAKGKPQKTSKLKAKATYAPKKGKAQVVTLKPVAAVKGKSPAHLAGRHKFQFPAGKGAKLDITLTGLGDDGKGKASFVTSLAETPVVTYVCPMHADQKSEDPGDCGKCGMSLKRREKAAPSATIAKAPAYVCPMHPKVTSDDPGKCPECKMKLKKK